MVKTEDLSRPSVFVLDRPLLLVLCCYFWILQLFKHTFLILLLVVCSVSFFTFSNLFPINCIGALGLVNGQDGSYFKNQIDYFSDRYRVIALDTRGHGKSPRGIKPFTIEQFSCDLDEFMKGLEISDAIILGFSDGANNSVDTK